LFNFSNLVLTLFFFCFVLSSCTKSSNSDPNADFTFSLSANFPPVVVVFTNNSNNASDYNWDFGNGTHSTEKNPTTTYSAPGTFTVTLTASGNGKSSETRKQIIISPAPRPLVSVSSSPMSIFLPNNCATSFIISNPGPAGVLPYEVRNSNLNMNQLVFTNPSGTILAGNSVTIGVSVDPSLIYSPAFLAGATLGLEVYTPLASNQSQTFLNVNTRGIAEEANNMIGIWNGIWTGNSFGASNPGQPSPQTPVNGTWSLNVQSVSTATNTASGTVTWVGTDYYWTYTLDGNGNITSATPVPFNATRTFAFNNSNATLIIPAPASACDRFKLIINDFPGSSYGVYGPRLVFDMNLKTNIVTAGGASSFTAWPFAPVYVNNLSISQSNGSLNGQKQ
jgi:PKD repeat protein